MNHHTIVVVLISISCLSFEACGPSQRGGEEQKQIELSSDVVVQELLPGVWLHTTYRNVEGYGKVGANGLVIINEEIAGLIDLPWTNKQTEILFNWVEEEHSAVVQMVVPTHSHIDCAGGLAEAHRKGAGSIAFQKTIELMAQAQAPLAMSGFIDKMELEVGDINVELSYIGGGHTIDNIVAWIPDCNVLFAGCLLKGLDFKSIGNTTDADLDSYPGTLATMRQKFGKAMIVVPGHGKSGGLELISHTENMLKKHIEHRDSVARAPSTLPQGQ